MSRLMWIAGVLLAVAGVAVGAIVLVALAPVAMLTLDTAAILLVGGLLSLGLAGVIEQVRRPPASFAGPAVEEAVLPAPAPLPRFDPRIARASMAKPKDAESDALPSLEVSRPTRETMEALEKARQEIAQAFEPKNSETIASTAAAKASGPAKSPEPDLPPVIEEEFAELFVEEQASEPTELYVLEERLIRDRAARLLSDGTVEAETDEGWMRFENLEHLNEYFDAMEAAKH